MGRPNISIGRGVKVYESPQYGRQDATCSKVNNLTGIIDCKASKTGKTYRNVKYRDDCSDADLVYWVELPIDFTAGSMGN